MFELVKIVRYRDTEISRYWYTQMGEYGNTDTVTKLEEVRDTEVPREGNTEIRCEDTGRVP